MENDNKIAVIENENLPIDSHNTRAIQEVQGAIIVAQRCPRDEARAIVEIQNACKHRILAEKAIYSYPRGGQEVTGPSIRLAEVLARCWGNVQYGIREVSTKPGETKYIAFCWDMQKNVRSEREFTQRHVRATKKGNVEVTSDRDIYELVASNASRRMRACILQLIPSYIVEDAIDQCEKTLKTNAKPIETRIKEMLLAFQSLGVSQDMIEKRVKHKVAVLNETEMLSLHKIYVSIKDGMSERGQWFDFESETKSKLNEKFSKKEEPKQEEKQEETVKTNVNGEYESI